MECGRRPMGSRFSPRAADGARTHDLLLTKEVLYQLSYSSGRTPQGRPFATLFRCAMSALAVIRVASKTGQSEPRDLNPQLLAQKPHTRHDGRASDALFPLFLTYPLILTRSLALRVPAQDYTRASLVRSTVGNQGNPAPVDSVVFAIPIGCLP